MKPSVSNWMSDTQIHDICFYTYTSHLLSHTPQQESVENRIFHTRSVLDPTDSVNGKKLCLHQSCGNHPAMPMSVDTSSLQGKHVDLPPAMVERNIRPEIILQLILVPASTCVPKHNLLRTPHSYKQSNLLSNLHNPLFTAKGMKCTWHPFLWWKPMTITWRIGPLLSLPFLCSFAIALIRQLRSSSSFDT